MYKDWESYRKNVPEIFHPFATQKLKDLQF